MSVAIIGVRDKGQWGANAAPPNFVHRWKFGYMLEKIKKIRGDLSENRLI
jgi:hypothetical protein